MTQVLSFRTPKSRAALHLTKPGQLPRNSGIITQALFDSHLPMARANGDYLCRITEGSLVIQLCGRFDDPLAQINTYDRNSHISRCYIPEECDGSARMWKPYSQWVDYIVMESVQRNTQKLFAGTVRTPFLSEMLEEIENQLNLITNVYFGKRKRAVFRHYENWKSAQRGEFVRAKDDGQLVLKGGAE